MGDPYWRYAAEMGESIPRAIVPGYFPSGAPALAPGNLWSTSHLRGASSEYIPSDFPQSVPLRPGGYSFESFDDIRGIGNRATAIPGGLNGFQTPLPNPSLIAQRQDVPLDVLAERTNLLRSTDALPADESNILFVGGLPTDCTRREVSHLFRPFIGFKEIRVFHREARQTGEKATVLCFVEFNDAKCAFTAQQALHGYKFDDKKPESPVLRIQFAKFPFRPPAHNDSR